MLPGTNATLANAAGNHKRRVLARLWLLSDAKRLADPTPVAEILPRGTALILRHTDARIRESLALRLAPLCRRRGIVFLVAGDWRLAAAVGADGLHLSERDARRGPSPGALLWLKGRGRLLTVAAHGERALQRAARMAASASILAPVFPTKSHPGRRALGTVRTAGLVRSVKRGQRIPVIGLGGITRTKLPALYASGLHGVAGIGFVLRA